MAIKKQGVEQILAHASSHQNSGSDEVSVASLSGELADRQKSKAGSSVHGWTDGKLLQGAGAGSAPTEVDAPDGPTKEFIVPYDSGQMLYGETVGSLGDHKGAYVQTGERCNFVTFVVPNDFSTLTSVQLIYARGSSGNAVTFTFNTSFGSDDEQYNANTDSYGPTATDALTSNDLYVGPDVSDAFTGIAAGDVIAANILATYTGGTLYILGFKFRYS